MQSSIFILLLLTAIVFCNAQWGIRWHGKSSCGGKRSLKAIPIDERVFADISEELENVNYDNNYESSGKLKNLKQSMNDADLINSLIKFRSLKTHHQKINFLRKYCHEILKITKKANGFGINKVCRQMLAK